MGSDIDGACGQLRIKHRDNHKENENENISMTDIGRKREINQDYVFATDETIGNLPNLLVVADGMGGHRAGILRPDLLWKFWQKKFRTAKRPILSRYSETRFRLQ